MGGVCLKTEQFSEYKRLLNEESTGDTNDKPLIGGYKPTLLIPYHMADVVVMLNVKANA
jgi:hypothetical protein